MKFNVKIGDKYQSRISLKPEIVRDFMAITGDNNPVHWNEDYCSLTNFETPAAHESLILAAISNVIGSKLPGKGSVITNMNISFLAPAPYTKWPKGRLYDIFVKVIEVKNGCIDLFVKFGRININDKDNTKYPRIVEVIAEGKVRVQNVFDMELKSNVD